jgi:hypothetical protein
MFIFDFCKADSPYLQKLTKSDPAPEDVVDLLLIQAQEALSLPFLFQVLIEAR